MATNKNIVILSEARLGPRGQLLVRGVSGAKDLLFGTFARIVRLRIPLPWFKTAQALLLALAVCFSVGATDASSRYDHLNHQMMCSCGCGQILGECNHVGCPSSPVQLAELRTAIASGLSDKEILASFSAKYGATVLAAPTTHGFDLVAWIAPFAVFAAALLGTILLVRHWSVGRTQPATPVASPEMDALRARVRRETDAGNDGGF
jgi:cytochrome c-type biogenesis protein CcmH/NrfF